MGPAAFGFCGLALCTSRRGRNKPKSDLLLGARACLTCTHIRLRTGGGGLRVAAEPKGDRRRGIEREQARREKSTHIERGEKCTWASRAFAMLHPRCRLVCTSFALEKSPIILADKHLDSTARGREVLLKKI